MASVPVVDLDALPKLDAADLRLLWVNDWHDGPLEAVVEQASERRLMILYAESEVDVEQPMRWVLFALSTAQWEEELRWHALFEEHVGHHWCFEHAQPSAEPTESPDPTRFFEPFAKRASRALDASAATGWVDEMPAR